MKPIEYDEPEMLLLNGFEHKPLNAPREEKKKSDLKFEGYTSKTTFKKKKL